MIVLTFAACVLAGGSVVAAQALPTYTGCHRHDAVEYCYGSDGVESPVYTYTSSPSETLTTPASVAASATATGQTTAITECHAHETEVHCVDGDGHGVAVSLTATLTEEAPAQYTGCHAHGAERFCIDPEGEEVLVVAEGAEEDHDHEHSGEEACEMDCHFHAGVEHCVPVGDCASAANGEAATASAAACELRDREYNVPLRIGTLFVVLVTSSIGVFLPMLIHKLPFLGLNGLVFTAIKQFGTGIIVSTAFVHLYTHAYLMFANQCLGRLQYEATTSAIVMAGIFIAWLVEYVGYRIVLARSAKQLPTASDRSASMTTPDSSSGDKTAQVNLASLGHHHGPMSNAAGTDALLSVIVMEAGILFHSVLIGLTLVVAGDSFYRTLLVVIVFHQFFEGLALGARISLLPGRIWWKKLFMGASFAIITPLGMAIGLGVLQHFNGNDRATIITIGTLDAVSAGILVWVGVVDMWARDWVFPGGELVDAKIGRVLTGGISLVAGLVLMSLLGKWA